MDRVVIDPAIMGSPVHRRHLNPGDHHPRTALEGAAPTEVLAHSTQLVTDDVLACMKYATQTADTEFHKRRRIDSFGISLFFGSTATIHGCFLRFC